MFLSNLNEYQRHAVLDDSTACLVNAQVGSGKTTVLISKVFYLHRVMNVPFHEMVVLTFTNKAANEIKERITSIDSSVDEEDTAYFGTFHSVALRLLKTILAVEKIGYRKDFSVTDPDEEAEMASRLVSANSLCIKYPNKIYQRMECALKGESTYANMKYEDDILTLLELLHNEKVVQNKMSFADLIDNAVTLLKESSFRPHWIIIDEFQDSDAKQLEFIRTLAGNDTKIFAVGDPNQIIYSWRGSNQHVFQMFKEKYTATELSLPVNYRSCSTILEAAKCFLASKSDLSGIREQGSKIVVKNHYNPFTEAQYLSDRVKEIVVQGNDYNDMAIFYRLQRQSSTIASVFERDGIPFEVSMRKTLKDIPVLNWFVKLLRFSVNTSDKDNACYVLTHSKYGEHFSPFEVHDILYGKDAARSLLLGKMVSFKDWCKGHSNIIDAYDYFEISKYINPTSSSFAEDKEYIMTMLQKIEDYIKSREASVFDGIIEFIDSSALYGIDILKDDINVDSDTVKLMTLHASKGLEFKYVFIIGANYGLIPLHTSSLSDRDEERRLFFVGITRAKDFLEISYYTSPEDQRVMPGASNYLSMIVPAASA